MRDEGIPGQDSALPLSAVTVRELRRGRALAPGGADFKELVRAFLPVVFGGASLLAPAEAVSIQRTVVGVFQAFGCQWRRLSRRTVVAAWLLRATWYAARREHARLGWAAPPRASPLGVRWAGYRALLRLRGAYLDALVLREVLGLGLAESARAMRRREARVASLAESGLTRWTRAVRREIPGVDARAFLRGIARLAPAELELAVLNQLVDWSPRQPRSDLVHAVRRGWRWRGLKRTLCWGGAAAAGGLVLLIVAVVMAVWLVRQGHLTAWFIRQSGRRTAKELPEVAAPARPWPGESETTALLELKTPRCAAELYNLTSIWTAKLSFTPSQWRAIAPSRVPPVPHLMGPDGTMVLRNPKARRSGLAGVVGLDFNWTAARLEFAGSTFSPVAARYRGNGTYLNSLFGLKQSFKVDLDKFIRGQSLAGIRTLNFVNSIPDDSYLHDALGQQVFRELGATAPRTAYAYLTLEVPGRFPRQPLGLYVLIENIDAEFAADRLGVPTAPLFKPVTTELFAYLGDDWSAYADIYDLKTKATPRQLDRVIDFARLVTQADDAEFARRAGDFLDLNEFAAFLAGHVLLASYDGFLNNGQNFYLYLEPRSQRFGFIPWDQDHGWGEFGYVGSADRRERASIWQPSAYRNHFLERVLQVEPFRDLYRRHLARAIAGPFTVEHLFPQIDQLGSILRPAVAAESAFRRRRFDVALSTNWTKGPRDGQPEGPRAPVHQIKRFIANRVQSVRDQLEGKAEGEVLGRARDSGPRR